MPKRDEHYMRAQREMIARAALECMLEKGFEATTLRDVASHAGISMGALYAHFKTRDHLIQAACSLDPIIELEAVDNWADYEQRLGLTIDAAKSNDRYRKMTAISYEFLADIIRFDRAVPSTEIRFDQVYEFFRASLQAMQARGEIALPLGVDSTIQLHIQLQVGATLLIFGDRRLDFRDVRDNFLQSLAFTAGRNAVTSDDVAIDGPAEACADAESDIDDRIIISLPQMGALSTRKSRRPKSSPLPKSSQAS